MIKTALKQVAGAMTVSMLVACGGGSSSGGKGDNGSTPPVTKPEVTLISGQAFKGPVYQATVIAFDDSDVEIGRTQTDQTGQYALKITPPYLGVVRVEVVGGRYIDEATGVEIALEDDLSAMKTLTGSDETVHITPLTELAVRRVNDMGGDQPTSSDVAASNQAVANAFSLNANIVATQPQDLLDDDSDNQGAGTEYALVIAGMSQMIANADGEKSLGSVLTTIDDDLGDDQSLDDNQLLSDLNEGINDFIDSPNNKAQVSKDDTDLDTQFKPLLEQPDALVFTNTGPFSAQFGDNFADNSVTGGTGDGELRYTSSNPLVAEVDAITGKVVIKAVGSVRIRATKAADTIYRAQSVSYDLVINKADQTGFAFVNAGPVQSTYGDAPLSNAASGGMGNGSVLYSSSDRNIARVDATSGTVTIVSVGRVTIEAVKAGDANYLSAAMSYELVINHAPQAPLQFIGGSALSNRLGDVVSANTVQGGSGNGLVRYRTSDVNIATVNALTGEVTPKAVGQVIISADKAGSNLYLPATTAYTLTVTKGTQAAFAFGDSLLNKMFGDGAFVNPIMGGFGAGAITFSSSDPQIASIASDGLVTLHRAGEVTITASKAGDSQYDAGTASYSLIIAKQSQPNFQFVAALLNKTFGDDAFSHGLQGESGTGAVSYRSADTGIASVDAQGTITLHSVGSVVIEATKAADNHYAEAFASFTVVVSKAGQASLVFTQPQVTKSFGDSIFNNTLSNSGEGQGAISYSSDDVSVATVDATGDVTITGAGSTIIRIHKAADEQYAESRGSYVLNVAKAVQSTLAFEQAQIAKTFGDGSFTHALQGGSGMGALSFISSQLAVASIDSNGVISIHGSGTATIQVTKAEDANYQRAQASFELVIDQAPQAPLQFIGGSALSYRLGDMVSANTVQGGSGNGLVRYQTSDVNIATVNTLTGEVTPKAVGQVIISADKAGNNLYLPATAAYTLTITKGTQAAFTFGDSLLNKTLGDGAFVNPIMGGFGTGAITFSSSDSQIASVASNGSVTLHSAGEVTITATKTGDSQYDAGTASYNLIIAKQSQPNFQFVAALLNKTFGDDAFSHGLQGESGTGAVSYRSADTGIASVDAQGTITLHSAGSVVIEVTKAADNRYAEAFASFTLVVSKAGQAGLVFTQPQITKSFGDGVFNNTLSESGEGQGAISYRSDNTNVATVDTNGDVTIVGAGSTIIRIHKAADEQYAESRGSYVLNVSKAFQSTLAFEQAQIAKTFGDDSFTHALQGGSGTGALSFISSQPTVAGVNSNGVISIHGSGTATIQVTKAEDTNYQLAQASFELVVDKAEQAALSFDQATVNANFGDSRFNNGLIGGSGSGALLYQSSNNAVADVDPSTGLVTVLSAGNATITVTKSSSNNYQSATASYALIVDRSAQSGLLFASTTVNKQFGDVTFSNAVAGGEGTGAVSYASSNTDIATVDGAGQVSIHYTGTVQITVTKAGDANHQTQTASFTLEVTRADQAALRFADNVLEKRIGDMNVANTLASTGSGNGSLSYAVSNTNIATVNANDGTLQVHGAGSTTVTVTKAADDLYHAATASFTLTVGKGDQQGFGFNQAIVNKTFGDSTFSQIPTGGSGIGNITYRSSDPSIASINSSGEVHLLGAGAITITATKSADDNYLESQASYQIVVGKAQQAALSFGNLNLGFDYGQISLMNPVLGGSGSGLQSYSSSDTGIALVDVGSGSVTAVRPGVVQIHVTKAGDANYLPTTASYTLTINKGMQQTLAFERSQVTRDFAEGDGPQTDFTNAIVGGSGTGLVTYDISDASVLKVQSPSVFRVLGAGSVTVTATKAADDYYREMTATFTLTVDKGEQATMNFDAETVNKQFGDVAFSNAVAGGEGTGAVSYASSNTDIATVDGAGQVSIQYTGTVQITVTKAGDANYQTQTASFTLVVARADQAALSFTDNVLQQRIGDTNIENTLASIGSGNGSLSYAVSNTNIATVNADDGTIQVHGVGSTTVTVTKAADDLYHAATASFTLTVDKGDQQGFGFNQAIVNKTFGDSAFSQIPTGGSGIGDITYRSSDPSIAVINSSGEVYLFGAGTITISATKSADDNYFESQASYQIVIGKAQQAAMRFRSLNSSFDYGQISPVIPVFGGSGRGIKSYSSSDTDIALVDAGSGSVTAVRPGVVQIHVTKAGDVNYLPTTASYTLTINKGMQRTLAFERSQVTRDFAEGDGSQTDFTNAIVGGSGAGLVTYDISDTSVLKVQSPSVFRVLGAGSATVTATKAADDFYREMTATFTLTIGKGEQSPMNFDADIINKRTSDIGKTLVNVSRGGSGTGTVTYRSDNTDVVSVDNNGVLTFNGFGSATITATKAGDTDYFSQTAISQISIVKVNQQSFGFAQTRMNVSFNDTDFSQTPVGGSGSGIITYNSSDDTKATVDSRGEVTLTGIGFVTISATKAGDDVYLPSTTSYLIEVALGPQGLLAFSEDVVNKRLGSSSFTVPLSSEGSGTGALTYISSDTNVATVSLETGEIRMRRPGSVTITVRKAGDSQYLRTSASMTLNIDKGIQGPISWAQTSVTKAYVSNGLDDNALNASGVGNNIYSFASSDPTVASVNNSGYGPSVRFKKVGTAVITAYRQGNDLWLEGDSTSYTLTITKGMLAPISFTDSQITVFVGAPNFINRLQSNPSGVQYSSSDDSVATITTYGSVTPRAAGSVTITATLMGGENYVDTSASYTLNVNLRDQDALVFEQTSITQAFSTDGFSNPVEGGSGSGALSYTSSDTSVATVDASGVITMMSVGTTNISVLKAADASYKSTSTNFDLTVIKGPQQRLLFTQAGSVQKQLSDPGFTNSVSGGSGMGAISFVSANVDIASVDAITGEVTLNGEGAAEVTATKAGDSRYLPISTSYRVNIANNHIVAFYDDAPNWNDYVKNDGIDRLQATNTTCDLPNLSDPVNSGTFNSCIHGGEMRAVEVPGKSDCSGLTATDALDAFVWHCDASSDPVRMVSMGLKSNVMMSDLLDFTAIDWRLNQVTVSDQNDDLFTTLEAAWWQNPVKEAIVENGFTEESVVYLVRDHVSENIAIDGASKIAVIVDPNIGSSGSANTTGEQHQIFVDDSHHVWLEANAGKFSGPASKDNINRVYFENVSFSVLRGAYLTEGIGGVRARNLFNSRLESIVVAGEYSPEYDSAYILLNFYFSFGNKLENISASNGSLGLRLDNSYRNLVHNAIISNANSGVTLHAANDSVLQNVTVVNSTHTGVRGGLNLFQIVLNNFTVVNAGMIGTVVDSEKAAFFYEGAAAAINNLAIVGTETSVAGIEADGQTSNSSIYQNLAIDQFVTAMIAGSHKNYVTGKFILGDISGSVSCANNEATTSNNNNMYALNANCTPDASPADFTRVNAPSWRNSAFVGWVTTDDTVNASDNNGLSTSTNFEGTGIDWVGFENTLRHWAIDGGLFEAATALPWQNQVGRIADWSLRASDNTVRAVLPKVLNGDASNTIAFGSNKPLFGNNPSQDNVAVRYLRNSVEILSDFIGNDNGLCESNETCLYTPNVGSYQGHGALISAGDFVDGNTITGVTLLQYETNGY